MEYICIVSLVMRLNIYGVKHQHYSHNDSLIQSKSMPQNVFSYFFYLHV